MWMLLYLSYTPIKNPCQPWVRMNGIASASSSASTSTRSIWYISIYSSGAYIWQGYELLYKGWCLWDLIIYISTEYWGRFPNLHILPPKSFTLDLGLGENEWSYFSLSKVIWQYRGFSDLIWLQTLVQCLMAWVPPGGRGWFVLGDGLFLPWGDGHTTPWYAPIYGLQQAWV